jgi:hypothetical protein
VSKKRLKLSLPTEALAPAQFEDMPRTPSSVSLPHEVHLPEETAQRLENYLRKNQSFSSIHALLNELQVRYLYIFV